LFGSLLAIGQAVQFKRTVKNQLIEDKYQGKSFDLRNVEQIGIYTLFSTIVCLPFILSGFTFFLPNPVWEAIGWLTGFFLPFVVVVMWFARNRLNTGVSICLMIIFWIIIIFNQIGWRTSTDGFTLLLFAVPMIWMLTLILLSVAPAKAVSRRLIFLAIGLIL